MIEFAPTRTVCGACALALATLFFSGCGELAYKRGASTGDLESAKKTCHEKGSKGNDAAYEKCMADSGWTVQNLGKMEPMDADPVIEASVIPSNIRIENATTATPGERHADMPSASGSTQAATRKPDMLDTFKVSSWWKAGSGASSLEADTNECVAQLGETHRPVQTQQMQTATRGLLLCMKAKGWSALRAK